MLRGSRPVWHDDDGDRHEDFATEYEVARVGPRKPKKAKEYTPRERRYTKSRAILVLNRNGFEIPEIAVAVGYCEQQVKNKLGEHAVLESGARRGGD